MMRGAGRPFGAGDGAAAVVAGAAAVAKEASGMDFGVVMFPTEYAIQPDELARGLEERGFESLWLPEHTHIPASRRSPWPGGGPLPREYWSSYDPFVALMAAGAATRRLRLGTGICLVIERDPIVTAKEVATLDRLSGGRVLFGIGGGWNAEEMEDHGTRFKSRWRVLRERVLAMKEIWTRDDAEFHGEFVNFDPMWSLPKPVQKPHPPIVIGGDGPTTFDRVVEYGDGWMPIMRPGLDPVAKIPALRERLRTAGRDPDSAPVSVFFAPPRKEALAALAAAGVARAIFGLPSEPRDAILPRLDGYAAVIRSM
jgi:probable F420-dependent oxidoreductase